MSKTKKILRIDNLIKRDLIKRVLIKRDLTKRNKTNYPLIRFYDNDMLNITQFKEQLKFIESIFVDNSPNKEILDGSIASLYTTKFLDKNPNNKYALYLNSLNNKEIGTDVGFSEKDAKNLKKWVNKITRKRVVVFDWDGCLSTIEGIILPSNIKMENEYKQNEITYKDIALYYAGGIKRFQMLKNLFKYLNKKKVRVFILTNNPSASCKIQTQSLLSIGPKSRDNFYKVVKQIIPQINKEDILCGFDDNYIKPVTFMKNNYLKYCYDKIINK